MALRDPNNEDLFNYDVLTKKIAEEEDLLTRLQMDLTDRQERKKKITSNIRTLTHKTKTLEESVTNNALTVEKLKTQKEKYISKVDKKAVNKMIDTKCENLFDNMLQDIKPQEMAIEVEFEGSRTTFKISDHRKDSYYNPKETEEDEPSKASVRGSMIVTDQNGNKTKTHWVCRTFKEMKEDVAAFFSLSTDNFFFADTQNSVFLDDLPIRPTLFPLGQKIKTTIPLLRIVLTNNAKYDDIIYEKIKEQIGETDVVDHTQSKAELKEAYDNEQARKKADQRRKTAAEYYAFKQKMYKFKGFFSSILYVVLIILWLINVFSNVEFDQTFIMRNSTETVFQTYSAESTATFYSELKNQLTTTTSTSVSYGFIHLNYIMPGAEVVITRYKPSGCLFNTTYMTKYYPSYNGTCTKPKDVDKSPYKVDGVTYNYDENSAKTVSIPTRKGKFTNAGYRLPIDFNDTNMKTKISNFVDPFVSQFVSFNFVLYNPSLEKMACIYRVVYRYNQDKVTVEKFVFVFNVKEQSRSSIIIQNLVLAIASMLVINSIFDMVDIVPASKVDLDLDLIWIKKSKKSATKDEHALRHKPKFRMIKLGGTVFKVFRPSVVTMLNLLSVTLNVIVVGLDIAKHNSIDRINFATGENIDCPSLIERDSVIQILYVVVIMLMMIVLLKYIAQFVPFLENFILIIQNLVNNTASLGILLLWLFLTIALFGVYKFGSFFPDLEYFGYFYTALILLLMKRNIILATDIDNEYFETMRVNIGSIFLLGLIIFSYVVVTFLIIKIITSIVIKSIKDAQGSQKSELKEAEQIKEESLNLLRERFFEEYRASQSKLRAKALEQPANQAATTEKDKEKDKKKK